MASPSPILATVSGSRTFANAFVVKWTPADQLLKMEITGGGSLLTINNFTPDNATQPVDGSGTLIALELKMVANSVPSVFKGAIGVW
jgi:hypothetical protein